MISSFPEISNAWESEGLRRTACAASRISSYPERAFLSFPASKSFSKPRRQLSFRSSSAQTDAS